jgi:hypothetical protein
MRFILQVYMRNSPAAVAALDEGERQAVFAEYEALSRDPAVVEANQLLAPDTATVVEFLAGEPTVAAGPASPEPLGGYYLIEAPDREEASAFAARIPAARLGGAVEVRELVER